MRCKLTVLAVMVFTWADSSAHGVIHEIEPGKTYHVTISYANGTPLASTAFEVRSPVDGLVHTVGLTDDLGRLGFTPDAPGTWIVDVWTPDGHGAHIVVPVDTDSRLPASRTVPRSGGILIGFGLILGVTAAFARHRSS